MNQSDDLDLEVFEAKRIAQYNDRWNSFGGNSGILEISEKLSVAELKKHEIFQPYDDAFLTRLSPDVSIATWKKNAVLFEEGTYINLAFFVLSGKVEIFVKRFQEQSQLSRPIFDLSRSLMISAADEGSSVLKQNKAMETMLQTQLRKLGDKDSKPVQLSSLDLDVPADGSVLLGPGEILGEIGAMNGWPQSVTARAATDCKLLQIRVSALRFMRDKSSALQERLNKVYRERSLATHLKTTPLLQNCDEAFIQALTQKVELVSLRSKKVIVKEGDPVDALYLVRSGFVKLSQQFGEQPIVLTYLSKGMTLGEVELLLDGMEKWKFSATSVEHCDLVKISRADFRELARKFPSVEKQLWESAVARIKETGASKRSIGRSEFIETALDKGLMEGTSILVIDLDTCTRCDDCVRGCADTHGGRPRFVREGDKYENFLIAKSCYHCYDPMCLIGCPTGAIRRANIGEVVEIADHLCIGCTSCAKNCPYDAIIMHDTGTIWGNDEPDEKLRNLPRLLASKCDRCASTNHEPACVNNCPHGCAIRVKSLEDFRQLLERRA